MTNRVMMRPELKLQDSVYSNFDHVLNESIAKELLSKKACSQHAAWNFCGYIWFENNEWHEEIWCYNALVKTLHGEEIMDVINEANSEYGSE